MTDLPAFAALLQRVNTLGRELELLRRDLLALAGTATTPARKPTLFGSVPAGDVTAEMIEDAQQDLLRPLDDL